MGKIMFALSFPVISWTVGTFYDVGWLLPFAIFLFVAIVIFTVIFINTSDRFI